MRDQCNPVKLPPGSPITPPCEYLLLLREAVDMLEETVWLLNDAHYLIHGNDEVGNRPFLDAVDDTRTFLRKARERVG